ncbi:uncharacterized protein KGF55_000751 [Candida pseudojiufengensis]|uniref:uncharacterized protein n=1 Tax=Candida pseudojiufengensis TaxID=497109 RepID=UPI00222401E2|nr:uncharacterized protein KGF55_000751 [Candida pseudojiufengensis]KAI5966442.1 hypothetical protein KGF55_000751 [Candida pseudojiufengensis]
MTEKVFVTGANGFIAQHIIKQLLAKNYKTVGSVRSIEKGENLKNLVNNDPNFEYVIIKDLTSEESFNNALRAHPETTIFLHTASPVTFFANDLEKDIIIPAINGTANMLKSIKKFGINVKHLVYTSSMATIVDTTGDGRKSIGKILTEDSWNQVEYKDGFKNGYMAYCVSKTLSEKLIHSFVEQEKPNFTVGYIQPTYVFGPQAFEIKDPSQLNSSAEMVNSLLKLNANDPIPPVNGDYIDVRDVAKAHIVAFEKAQETNGKRMVLTDSIFTNELLCDIINKNFPKLGVPKGNFEENAKQIKEDALTGDYHKTKELLGFDYIPIEQSIIEMVQQIIDAKQKVSN